MQISNLGGSELNYQTASYTNLTSALAPQSHVAKLQLFTAGNMFCIYHWTYAILHA